jgi:hypothetical protein
MAGQACRYGAFQRPLRRSVVKGQYQRPSGLQLDPPPHVVPAVLDGALHRRLAPAPCERASASLAESRQAGSQRVAFSFPSLSDCTVLWAAACHAACSYSVRLSMS